MKIKGSTNGFAYYESRDDLVQAKQSLENLQKTKNKYIVNYHESTLKM